MDFFELLDTRRSVRAFAPRPLEASELDAILNAARRAPSAGNLQSWAAVVVDEPAALLRVAAAAHRQSFIAEAPVAIVFCAEPARAAAEYGARGASLYCVQDATIACAYAQLAATALGLGSVWVGAFDEVELAGAIHLDRGLRPVAILPLGSAAERGQPTKRRSLDALARRLR